MSHCPLFSSVVTALLSAAAAGLSSSLGSVPGSQASAPNLNPPSQIDPSSIERAYAALGLTYQGNQIQGQHSQPNMPNQALQGQPGMRAMNPMGKLAALKRDLQEKGTYVCFLRDWWLTPAMPIYEVIFN